MVRRPPPRTGNSPRARGRVKPIPKPRASAKTRQANYARTVTGNRRSGSTKANPFNITVNEYRSAVARQRYLKSPAHASAALKKAMVANKAERPSVRSAVKPSSGWKPYRGKQR